MTAREWETWRGPDGTWRAFRMYVPDGPHVPLAERLIIAATEAERDEKIRAWEDKNGPQQG